MQRNVLRTIGIIGVAAGMSAPAFAGGPFPPGPGNWGPDFTLCQLYGLSQTYNGTRTRVGDTVGLGVATTSWNIGTVNALWLQSPNSNHPFIAQNMYQWKDNRFRQIGQSWCKHGFFALSNLQCGVHPYLGTGCSSTNGSALGVGCTDTYSTSLNMDQGGLGPRYEINPWRGTWQYTGSVFQAGGVPSSLITRRLQVKDADLAQNLNSNNTAQYFVEACYVSVDDVDFMNNAGWKPVTVTGNAGGNFSFTMSGSTVDENSGFAIDFWKSQGARLTMVAQQFPIVEDWSANNPPRPGTPAPGPASPDGRAIIASQVRDLGNGTWRYEYAVLNIDMDRQIREFTVPVPAGVTVTNIGFWSVPHHNEPFAYSFHNGVSRVNGPPIDNSAWPSVRGASTVSWSTAEHQAGVTANPLRWGTMYNFWFDANQPPTDALATLGLYRPGTVNSVQGVTDAPAAPAPTFCVGDADGSGSVNFSDITTVLANFGATYTPGSAGAGDADDNGSVNFSDVTIVLANFGSACN